MKEGSEEDVSGIAVEEEEEDEEGESPREDQLLTGAGGAVAFLVVVEDGDTGRCFGAAAFVAAEGTDEDVLSKRQRKRDNGTIRLLPIFIFRHRRWDESR